MFLAPGYQSLTEVQLLCILELSLEKIVEYTSVTIGDSAPPNTKCPRIGNNVFIGTGAVIVGDVEIADGIAIGANSSISLLKNPTLLLPVVRPKRYRTKDQKTCDAELQRSCVLKRILTIQLCQQSTIV